MDGADVANRGSAARSTPGRNPLWGRIMHVALLLGAACVLLFVTSLPPICPVRLLFHVPCPSCGLTRAARLVLAGDFAGATHMHPLWFLVLPSVGAFCMLQLAHYLGRGELAKVDKPAVRYWAYVLLGLLVVVWVARFFGAFGGPCPV